MTVDSIYSNHPHCPVPLSLSSLLHPFPLPRDWKRQSLRLITLATLNNKITLFANGVATLNITRELYTAILMILFNMYLLDAYLGPDYPFLTLHFSRDEIGLFYHFFLSCLRCHL